MPAQTPNSSVQFPKTALSDGAFIIGTPGDPLYVVVEGGGGSGTLPTSDAADGVIGSPIPADAIQIGGENPSGNLEPVQLDTNNQLITSSLGLTLSGTGQVSVGNSSTMIVAAVAGRAAVLISNPSAVTVYIGVSGVTTVTGFPLAAGTSITIPTVSAVYGVVVTGSQTVGFISLTE